MAISLLSNTSYLQLIGSASTATPLTSDPISRQQQMLEGRIVSPSSAFAARTAPDSYTPSSQRQTASSANSSPAASPSGRPSVTQASGGSVANAGNLSDIAAALQSAGNGASDNNTTGANGTMAAALKAAEQDGVQLVQWMQNQVTNSGASQGASSANAESVGSGESLAGKFASDLATLGNMLDGNAAETSDVQTALVSTIAEDTRSSAGPDNYSLSFSASSFDSTASTGSTGANAGANSFSLHITDYNLPGSSVNTADPYDFAVAYSSSQVSTSSSTSSSDGSNTSTSSIAEASTFAAIGDTSIGNGESILTSTVDSTVIGASASISTNPSDGTSTLSSAGIGISDLAVGSMSIHAGVSANTDAALMALWTKSLASYGMG